MIEPVATEEEEEDVAPKEMQIRQSQEWETDKTVSLNWSYPSSCSYDRHIIGVSNYNDGFQFVFSDETRTEVDQSGCEEDFKDILIKPEGSVVYKVFMQYDNYDEPFLVGLKFINKAGKTLLSAGLIDKASRVNNPNFPVKELVI